MEEQKRNKVSDISGIALVRKLFQTVREVAALVRK